MTVPRGRAKTARRGLDDGMGKMVTGGLRFHGSWSTAHGQTDRSAIEMAAIAKQWEDDGFDYVPYGDTLFRDCYVCLGAMAAATATVGIGPYVTNPSTRSAVVTAQAIASVDEISGGRAWLGIGLGNSANAINGMAMATPDDLRRALVVFNSVLRRAREYEEWPGLEIDESVVELEWVKRRVPVLIAARAMKGQRIAAEMADGLMLRAGDVPHERLHEVMERVLRWREEGPLAGEPFEVQILDSTFVGDPERARRYLGSTVATRGGAMNTKEKDLPDDLRARIVGYQRRYNYGLHGSSLNRANIELIDELGLDEYFYGRFMFVGDDDALIARWEEMEAMGITAVHAPEPAKDGLRVVAKYREKHPMDPDAAPSPLRPKPQGALTGADAW